MNHLVLLLPASILLVAGSLRLEAQPLGQPDRGAPGDEMIQNHLRQITDGIHAKYLNEVTSREQWGVLRNLYKGQYLYMLGLSPRPPQSDLKPKITGTFKGDGYRVDMIHFQSRQQLYVTGNLYRPDTIGDGKRLPAILYVCGHSNQGRNGNKAAYQSHGIWFARHGYVCLVIDTLQLGEIAATHHGTYREQRWWWHSRGYTPAGVECWNGIRAIDYLVSRADVDPERIGLTGISGGGAVTYWIAAADERIKVAVPVSGMADLPSYVTNRVINGHCDCMFLHNTFEWPWTRIANLLAPRPQLFVNSDKDGIFPMDANDRVINRLERLYSLYGQGDHVDSVVSIGGHAYRKDIRQAAYRFLNLHLKNDPSPVHDSEIDLVTTVGGKRQFPIKPETLRVFKTDADIPSDEQNTTIDRHFVPIATVPPPKPGGFDAWKGDLMRSLRNTSFRWFPERVPAATMVAAVNADMQKIETEPGIHINLRRVSELNPPGKPRRILIAARTTEEAQPVPEWLQTVREAGDLVYEVETRGVGATRWTRKNPPNYVERSLVLLGRTADAGRVWDMAAAARFVKAQHGDAAPIYAVGHQHGSAVAAYAGLLEEDISGLILHEPPASHMATNAPQILNVLRVCDVPDVVGMLAPKRLTIYKAPPALMERVIAVYSAASAKRPPEFR